MGLRENTNDGQIRYHLQVRPMIAQYATALALGGPLPVEIETVQAHLHSCPACTAELVDLLETLHATSLHRYDTVENTPPPDLSFLQSPG